MKYPVGASIEKRIDDYSPLSILWATITVKDTGDFWEQDLVVIGKEVWQVATIDSKQDMTAVIVGAINSEGELGPVTVEIAS